MDPPTPRLALACALSLLLLSTGLAVADATPGDPSGVVDEPANEPVEASDETAGTVDGATNETVETTNATAEESDGAANDTTGTLDEPSNETVEASDETTGTVEDAVDGTTDETLKETTNATVEGIDDAGERPEETVDGATDELDGTVEAASDALLGTVDRAPDALHGPVAEAGDGVHWAESRRTAEHESSGWIPGSGTSRREPRGDERVPDEESDHGHTAGADTGGEFPASGSGGGPAAGLLAVVVLSAAAGGTANALALSGTLWPQAERIALRIPPADVTRPWRYVLALRFSRHDGSDPLDHERRRAIHDAIADAPGVYLSELGERSDLSLSSVRHHLRVLERENLIRTEKVRGKRRFYPIDVDGTALVAALSDAAVRRLLETLAALGEARNDRLADELDRSPSTISHHLTSLEEDGLVVREQAGRATVNRLPATVMNALGGTATDGGEPATARDRTTES
ncbi:winged helix-turn-helix transcriptional regulator [Halorarum salinum]|uniref:Helix-turn-helix domain-containing protein n=1 Tax=Halorarum salinum TaxID=2743089 RepID=A0A7D5QAU7_9EURY|nr:helix-turn-helix domain-containing protein [Halobaculum salinum]QLG61280.1 helix-turn-helix domain-containing protein [Halobaculum salinum]